MAIHTANPRKNAETAARWRRRGAAAKKVGGAARDNSRAHGHDDSCVPLVPASRIFPLA